MALGAPPLAGLAGASHRLPPKRAIINQTSVTNSGPHAKASSIRGAGYEPTLQPKSQPLAPRHQWENSIAEMEVTRWSITFRSLARTAGLTASRIRHFCRAPRRLAYESEAPIKDREMKWE